MSPSPSTWARLVRRLAVIALIILALATLGLLALALFPGRVEPMAWHPPLPPPLVGPLAANQSLAEGAPALLGTPGPEAFAIGPDRAIVTGTLAGEIIRFRPPLTAGAADLDPGHRLATWARQPATTRPPLDREVVLQLPGGRPLGMAFAADGLLIVADARLGLLEVDLGASSWRVLVDRDQEGPFGFVDDVAIGPDGVIYFTDASRKWDIDTYLISILELPGDGRVYAWHPRENRLERLADGLQFANGVALTADTSALLVTETATYRVVRIALTGPERGRVSTVAENLPGYPDNIRVDDEGMAWVAMASTRKGLADRLHPHPALKRLVCRLPQFLWRAPAGHGLVLRLDPATGTILESLHDPTGRVASHISTAHPLPQALLIGSYERNRVVVVARE